MTWVSAQREVVVPAQDRGDVLARVRDGLVRRGRWIDPRMDDGIGFRGGWALAWRTSRKPIAGSIRIDGAAPEFVVHVTIRDAAVRAQLSMFGFERRQYEAAIDRELNEIQRDAMAAGRR